MGVELDMHVRRSSRGSTSRTIVRSVHQKTGRDQDGVQMQRVFRRDQEIGALGMPAPSALARTRTGTDPRRLFGETTREGTAPDPAHSASRRRWPWSRDRRSPGSRPACRPAACGSACPATKHATEIAPGRHHLVHRHALDRDRAGELVGRHHDGIARSARSRDRSSR